jgi:UDP-glucose 4-epimerase
MSILLTGGAGYIGSHTAVELMQAGYEVVVADNFSNSSPDVLRRIEAIAGAPLPFYEIDVCDPAALRTVFRENSIDAVIHLAGLKAVGESVREPLRYYRNNLDSALSLLEVMAEYGVKRFVFSSSATVYGLPDSVPVAETAPTGACFNPYGRTKYMIEEILKDAAVADPALSVVLLRYFNPIGAHESGLLGEAPEGIPNNLMPYITQVAIGKLPKLNVFGNDYPTPDGTGIRDYIHVVDLARGHVKAIAYASVHAGCEVFNLGTGIGYSVLDIVRTFEEANGVPVPYVIAPRRPGDIAEYWADPAKAARVLGWRAEKSLSDMCRDSWRWEQRRRTE